MRLKLDMYQSEEAAGAFRAAFNFVIHEDVLERERRDGENDEMLQICEVRYMHALRRLKAAHPGSELCGLGVNSAASLAEVALKCASIGHPIEAWDGAVAQYKAWQKGESELWEL